MASLRAALAFLAAVGAGAPVVPHPPLTLSGALALARRANPDLKEAAARADAADSLLSRARAELYPSLAVNVNYQASDNPLRKFSFLLAQNVLNPATLFAAAPSVDNLQGELHAQYLIYSGGARPAQIRTARMETRAAQDARDALGNRVMFQVAEAYLRVYQARELVTVRREAVDLVKSQLETVNAQVRANSAVRADALTVELHLSEVEEALISARTALALGRAVLENVTGAALSGYELPQTLEPPPWTAHVAKTEAAAARLEQSDEPAPAEAIAEAGQLRGELAQAADQERSAEARVEVAKAARRPTLGLSADYDTNTGDLTATRGTYFVALAFSVNVFDAGRARADPRQAQAALEAAVAHNQRARLDIELDVKRALLAYRDARAKLAVSSAAVASARENLGLVESRFRNQVITVTQLLDAQVALTEARVKSTTARTDLDIAAVGVERAIGRMSAFSREALAQ